MSETETTPAQTGPFFMPLPFGGDRAKIYGGPYYLRPLEMTGVKLAQEINLPCDINLPIADYSIPRADQAESALIKSIEAMGRGEVLYAGCMGGKGRTGLFMALLAKAAGEADPIAHVRSTYYEHAVETREQERFVQNFEISRVALAYQAASEKRRSELASTPQALASPQAAAPAAPKPF